MGVFVEAYREFGTDTFTVNDLCNKCIELGVQTNYVFSTNPKKPFFINLPYKVKKAMEDSEYDFSAVKDYPGNNEMACGLSFDGESKSWYINGNTPAVIALLFCKDISEYSLNTDDKVRILDVWNTNTCPIDKNDKIFIDVLFDSVGLDYPFKAGITKVKTEDGQFIDVSLPETIDEFFELLDGQEKKEKTDEIEVSTAKRQKTTKKAKSSAVYEVNFPGTHIDFMTDSIDVVISAIKKQAYICTTDEYAFDKEMPVKFKDGKHPGDLDFAKIKDIPKIVDGVEIVVHEVLDKKKSEEQGLLATEEEIAALENDNELSEEEEINLD